MGRVTIGVALILAVLTSGCGASSNASDQKIDQQLAMKNLLIAQLRDPDSAKFEQVKAYKIKQEGGWTTYNFCGTVNAKNGFGGYSGPRRFSGNASMVVLEDSASDFEAIWNSYCRDNDGGEPVWL